MKTESKLYEITCIAPLHIGSGEKLSPFDYLYDSQREEMYFLNPTLWAQFLVRHKLIDKIVDQLQQKTSPNLIDWLHQEKINDGEMRKLALRTAKAVTNDLKIKGKRSLNEVASHIALADGRPYVPGSSIKGALRTGILYRLLTDLKDLREKYWKQWMEIPVSFWKKETEKKVSRGLEQELLHRLNLEGTKAFDAVNSALRGLSVSDAVPVFPVETIIIPKRDATTNTLHEITDHTVSLYRECLPAGTKLRFSLSFDAAMMKRIGIFSPKEIIAATKRYIQDGLTMQEKVFGRIYSAEFAEAKDADLMLGAGTGFLAKTLFYRLAPDEHTGQKKLAEYFDNVFSGKNNHYHQKMDQKITPRTLKLAQTQRDRYIMGLCAMKELSGC